MSAKSDAPKIAILGAAPVQEDAVRVAQSLGVQTLVIAQAADGPAAAVADDFVAVNFMDRKALTQVVADSNVDVVYSTGSDMAMPVSAALSERRNSATFVSEDTARICNDKVAMRQATQGLPGAVPAWSASPGEFPDDTGEGPWIVKPADAQGQRGVQRIDDSEDLEEAVRYAASFSRSGRAIIERFIGGTEVSVNGYLVGGDLLFCEISDRETWPQYTGLIRAHVVPSIYGANPAVVSAIEEVLEIASRELGITNGPVYAQMKIENDVPFLIEITPRLDGCHMWLLLHYATGVNLMEATLRHLVFGVHPDFSRRNPTEPWTLEFHCQEPNTPATFPENFGSEPCTVHSYRYYTEDSNIRPVNGRYEKIGYRIFPSKGR